MDRNEPEPLWTAEEVAAHLRKHPQTIYRMAREGTLPSLKIGSDRRFRPSEIEAWVAAEAAAAAEKASA